MKALIVEDESVTRKLLERALEKRGHDVTNCKTGEQAYEFLENDTFPLLVLDVVLPGMGGLGLRRWIRTQSCGEYS